MLPVGHEPLNRLVYEMFSINVADTQTQVGSLDTETDRETRRLILRVA